MTTSGAIRRLLYGALFVIGVPAGLLVWAGAAAPVVLLPAIQSTPVGVGLMALGIILLAAGARDLMVRGGGLPMNAFPPPRLVRAGLYRWLRNPMYLGFGLIAAGAAIAAGSPAGLWLVTPVAWLGMAALVFGFERHDLRQRFGDEALAPPRLSIPRGDGAAPTVSHRIAVSVWVLLPWLGVYYAIQALGPAPDAFRLGFAFEREWPVVQWTELFYASTYVLVPLTVLLARTRSGLRAFATRSAIATAVVALCWLTIPVVATNRPFEPAHVLGRLLAFEQGHSKGVAAFPAFHVLWTLIAAETWSDNTRATGRIGWARAGWLWAGLIATSCLTTGMHTLPEVGAAFILFPLFRRVDRTWSVIRGTAEWLANAWKEWRLGPVRIINHGVFAAAAAGVGLMVAGSAAGPRELGPVIWIGWCVLIGAGLWAQALEGSSALLRPFGWYGGIVGGVIGAFAARLAGVPVVPLLAAFAIAAPWIQILGRLRCLVQGCCHGAPTSAGQGIRYRHRRSRVTQLASLAGVPIHPTPLYSIAGNVVIGVVLIRLRVLSAPDSLVLGLYLILGGLARFVEESYRGEPQTPVVAGLRIYQWLAVASVLMGVVCTALPAVPAPVGFTSPGLALVGASLALAVATGFAMGVDFPGSNRRFSRLAPAD